MVDLSVHLSDELRREIERKEVNVEDAETIARFETWLCNAGPPNGPLTEDQKAFRRAAFADPEWSVWLGFDGPFCLVPKTHPSRKDTD